MKGDETSGSRDGDIQSPAAAFKGADLDGSWQSRPTTAGLLVAACEAMGVLETDAAPVVLRFPVNLAGDLAMPVIAGTFEPPWVSLQLCKEARRRLSSCLQATGGRLYLAGWDSSRYGFCWGERATALSTLAADHQACLGSPPPVWATLPIVPAAQDRTDTSCPICYEDFGSILPSPLSASRCPPGR